MGLVVGTSKIGAAESPPPTRRSADDRGSRDRTPPLAPWIRPRVRGDRAEFARRGWEHSPVEARVGAAPGARAGCSRRDGGGGSRMDLPLERDPRYQSLDLWRGLACLMVVVDH